MKLKQKDKNLIFYLLGALLIVAGLLSFNQLSSAKAALEQENTTLASEVAYLQDLANNEAEYKEKTNQWNEQMDEMKAQFPANVKPEDQIMYAYSLEQAHELMAKTLEMPPSEMVLVDPPTTEETVVEDNAAEDNATAETDQSNGDNAGAVDTASMPSATTQISLSRARVSLGFQITYEALKNMIKQINTDAERKSVESLDVSYDENTGNLVGTLNFNMFSLAGTDAIYLPPSVNGVGIGTDDVFKSSKTLNSAEEKDAADGNADDTAEEGAEADDDAESTGE